ncbi:hypothetical protein ACFPWS_26990 [Streptomyces aureus]|uniref:hypothetical protein n=1 Tax=Streptomyces aureus TaxID=193461 RepID=UPI0031DA7032
MIEQAGVGEPGGVVGVYAQQQTAGRLLHRQAPAPGRYPEEFSLLDAGGGLDEYILEAGGRLLSCTDGEQGVRVGEDPVRCVAVVGVRGRWNWGMGGIPS